MTQESILGDMEKRLRTEFRLPKLLVQQVEPMCRYLGIPKNAYFALAAALLTLELAPLVPSKRKRLSLVASLEKFLLDTIEKVKKAV